MNQEDKIFVFKGRPRGDKRRNVWGSFVSFLKDKWTLLNYYYESMALKGRADAIKTATDGILTLKQAKAIALEASQKDEPIDLSSIESAEQKAADLLDDLLEDIRMLSIKKGTQVQFKIDEDYADLDTVIEKFKQRHRIQGGKSSPGNISGLAFDSEKFSKDDLAKLRSVIDEEDSDELEETIPDNPDGH